MTPITQQTLAGLGSTLLWTAVAGVVGALIGGALDITAANALRRWARRRDMKVMEAADISLRGFLEVWGALIGMAIVRPAPGLSAGWDQSLARFWVAAAIVSFTWFGARLTTAIIKAYTHSERLGGPHSGSSIVNNIARAAIWAVGLTFVLSALGVQVGPLVAALGVTGVAVSLGLQGILANLFNGLQILMTRQFEPGHYIKLQSGDEGEVIDITWRDTQLLTPNGDLVVVPNSVLGTTAMRNYSRGQAGYILAVPFIADRGTDLDAVVALGTKVAADLARHLDEVDASYEPSCHVVELGGDGVRCKTLIGIHHYRKRGGVMDRYLRDIDAALRELAPAEA